MQEKGDKIIIEISDSLYAHGFTDDHQIHKKNMDRCLKMIHDHLKRLKPSGLGAVESPVALTHRHETFGVFGDRGSGKTSFMMSLLEKCGKECPEAVVLRMIDPTFVEHKKPMALCVLAMINRLVDQKLKKSECSATGRNVDQRRRWEKVMKDIATGVIAIDQVGKGYTDSLWQDVDYVYHTGLGKVKKANEFERYIREMLTLALDILGDKKAFILAFDDIDMDIEQGWNVLESIRRYFSDSRIISIVSGNLKLYGMIVRKNLSGELTLGDKSKNYRMANELESQYMLKLLKPERRINLMSLKSLILQGDNIVVLKNGTEIELSKEYSDIVGRYGITDTTTRNTFVDFLESMSLRSQINFIKEAGDDAVSGAPESLSVFASRLYAAGIDWDVLLYDRRMVNIAILDYLLSSRNLPDSYLLLPNLPDKDANSILVAFTFLCSSYFKKTPYLLFDYILRIGLLRNLTMPMTGSDSVQALIRYAGWNQVMSLKNSLGLTMAYCGSKSSIASTQNIPLYSFASTSKKADDQSPDAIDLSLKKLKNDFDRLLCMFPFLKITNSVNNNGSNFYSVYSLLAAICEILKCGFNEEMERAVNDLKQFRSYLAPDDGDTTGNELAVNTDDMNLDIRPESVTKLAAMMWKWKQAYDGSSLPPYALGRIATRMFNAFSNVDLRAVGERLNIMVCDFINACIVEESKVRTEPSRQSEINNGNPKTDTKVLTDNLKKHDIVDHLKFSNWIMKCPLLISFVDDKVYEEIKRYSGDKEYHVGKIFDVLSQVRVNIPRKSKPRFLSVTNKDFNDTYSVLLSGGFTDEEIEEKIIKPTLTQAKKILDGSELFKEKCTNDAIKDFKNEWKAKHPGNKKTDKEKTDKDLGK